VISRSWGLPMTGLTGRLSWARLKPQITLAKIRALLIFPTSQVFGTPVL
jgi:hypothetical protein